MRILSLVFLLSVQIFRMMRPDHPHGEDFKISCDKCHSSKGWFLDEEIYSFNHDSTSMPLTGQHINTGCRRCHPSLVFTDAGTECYSCHEDIHQTTTGDDCGRCHNTSTWLVNNISELHMLSRFPLVGAHRMADCSDCHRSASQTRFDVAGIECIDCHRSDYMATTTPGHRDAGFSEDCANCHSINAFQWSGAGFNHNFFPLVQGHSGIDCTVCHTSGPYSAVSSDCNSCHQTDYNTTVNPNHQSLGFSVSCSQCHSLSPGWRPAAFAQHDAVSFPIYSGEHRGEWDSCTDCHTNPADYKQFSCLNCHEHNKTSMDSKHREENGYVYVSSACYDCHPRGKADKK